MKPYIAIGQTYTFEITVTREMRAHFETGTIHSLYSTAAMVTHMEWAARQHILPVLEPDEEGVGCHVTLNHLNPVPLGETVRISAQVTGLRPGKVICKCTAYHGGRKIGQGTVIQAILPLSDLHARIPSNERIQ